MIKLILIAAISIYLAGEAIYQAQQVRIEQDRIACMLAHNDEIEEESCLPPTYGSDW